MIINNPQKNKLDSYVSNLSDVRELILANLPVGTPLQGGRSSVTSHNGDPLRSVTVTRSATGSTVTVGVQMVQKTIDRLDRDEFLGKRSISGTSTTEATVAAAIGMTFDGERWSR